MLTGLSLLHICKTIFFSDSCEQKKNKGGKTQHFWFNEPKAFPFLYHSTQERLWSMWNLAPEESIVGQQAKDQFVTFLECRPGGRNRLERGLDLAIGQVGHFLLCLSVWLIQMLSSCLDLHFSQPALSFCLFLTFSSWNPSDTYSSTHFLGTFIGYFPFLSNLNGLPLPSPCQHFIFSFDVLSSCL